MIQRYQIFYGLLILSTFFSWKLVKEKYGWTAFLLLTWILIDAVLIFSWPGYTVDTLSLRLRLVSARSFVLVAVLVYFVSSLHFWNVALLAKFFEVMVVIECGLYLYFGYGLVNAGSADMSFISMVYPMMLFRRKITWLRLPILLLPLACLFFKVAGSTVFFSYAVGIGTYLLIRKKWFWFLLAVASLMATGYYVGENWSGGFFYNSGRFEPWLLIMNWWYEWANMWLGTGTGTFQWLGPTIQNKDVDLLVFLHNEYLQILFEQGLLGIGLMFSLIFICLKKAWKTPWLFSCCMSTLFVFSVQFPLRFLLPQIFVLLLVRLCFDYDSVKHLENKYD